MATVASGIGTSLSSNYYLRNFYNTNRDARTSSKRNGMEHSTLSAADSKALRRAIKQLGNFEYTDEKETDIRSAAKAFVEVYNNAVSSASTASDNSLAHSAKQLQSLVKEYASDLDKIGITVNADGTLKRRDTLFSSAGISKFEKLFSADADFMQRTTTYAKHIERRSNALISTEQHQKLIENSKKETNTVVNTGIGSNINIVL